MSTSAQKRIEESALVLFSHQGYHETSISQIAKKARSSEVTIFRIFGTKESLYLEVIKKYFNTEDINLKPLMSELTFEDLHKDLVKIVIHFYRVYFERIHITRIMISNYIQFDEIREFGSLILKVLEDFAYKYLNEMILRNEELSENLLLMPPLILKAILKDIAFLTTFNKKDNLDDEMYKALEAKWNEQISVLLDMVSFNSK